MNFRERNDAELARLGDGELIAYIVDARRAGRIEAAVMAAQVLALRYEPRIRGYVATRLQSKGRAVSDDVAERTISDAIVSVANFEGESLPEFGGWIFQIAKFRIVDYHRKGRVDEAPLEFKSPDGEWVRARDRERRSDRGDRPWRRHQPGALGAERRSPGGRDPRALSSLLAQGGGR